MQQVKKGCEANAKKSDTKERLDSEKTEMAVSRNEDVLDWRCVHPLVHDGLKEG